MADNIAKVAKELGIPCSKLRYWDKCGLIRFERDEHNNYRKISFQSMLDICDIVFYRSFAMPIEKIHAAAAADCDHLQELLLENRETLEQQIDSMRLSIDKIDERVKVIKQLQKVKAEGFSVVEWCCPTISIFDFSKPKLVQIYLEQPHKTLALLPCTEPLDLTYGVFSDQGDVIQQQESGKKQYVQGVFEVCPQKNQSNLQEFIDVAASNKQLLGNMIAEYLVTTGGEIKTDYYIGRAEIVGTIS